MNIGTLDFEIIGKNDGIKRSLEEAKESIKNFTETAKDGGIGAGDAMQAAAAKIEQAWGQLESVGNANREALKGLEAEYTKVGQDAAAAFSKATAAGDKEYRTLTARQQALGKEIRQRKDVLNQVEQLTAELNQEEQAFNKLASETQKNESRTTSFRMQLRQLTQEMAMQEAQARQTGGETAVYALRATDAFKQMQLQAAQLTDAMGDAQQQARILSHDNAGLQGVISAVGGVAGAFSVAQGAVGLFAGESEDLQKIMVKVQSIMAITMGLQQVANTLNKDSAASLTIFNKVREAFVLEMQRGNAALEADTAEKTKNAAATELNAAAERTASSGSQAATGAKRLEAAASSVDTKNKIANTAATGAQTIATKGLQRANILLSASFKAVGVAIKSIPVIGWILAGVSALVGIISALTKRSREAKKAQEELYATIAEGAKDPIAEITRLQAEYDALGVNVQAKKKFIDDNKEAFKKLGVEVNNLADAERLLNSQKDAFVAAQVAKAKALALQQKAAEKAKEIVEKQLELEEAEIKKGTDSRKARALRGEIAGLEAQMKGLYDDAVQAEKDGGEILKRAGIQAVQGYTQGMVGWYEQAISQKKEALKKLTNPKDYKAAEKEIETLQKTLDGITGAKSKSTGTSKDPFKERLEKQKQQYTQYAKWRNSTDEILQQAAATQFQTLLQQGNSYLDYLKKQREKLMSEMVGDGTKAQRKNLATLNDAIAEETKSTVLEQFDQELQRQLNGANSLIEKLAIIERKRRELANDGSELDQAQAELLQKQREQVANEMESQYREAQQEYYDYLESRLTAFEKYQADMTKVQTEYDRVEQVLNNAKAALDKDPGNEALEQQVEELERQLELVAKKRDTLTQQQLTRDAQATDELVEQYRSAEEKITAIANEHSEKKRVLKEREKVLELDIQEALMNGDTKRAEKLQQELEAVRRALLGIDKDLSKAAAEFLANDIVGKFLDDADNLTVTKINELIAQIEAKEIEIPADISDSDLLAIIEKLRGIRKEIAAKNPFEAMKNNFVEFKEAMSSGDLTKIAGELKDDLGGIGEVFNSITKSLADMGVGADEATQSIISDIGGMLQGATDVAAGIASGNYLQAITGGVQLVTNAVKLWNDANRENAETIKAAEAKVKEFESAIKKMRNTLARTYDSSRYDLQREIQDKLAQEIAEEKRKLEAMQRDMQGSSSDYTQEDIDAQIAHIEDLEEQLTQGYEALAEDLTQTTIPEIGQQITDALVDAFANGLDAANIDKELEKVVNDILKNTALNLIKTNLLMPQIKEWYEAFNAALDDNTLTEDEVDALRADLMARMQPFKDAIEAWNQIWGESEDSANTLSGALKGASQESIDLLAGYTNATRIIEQSQLDIMTRQLSHIASIDARLEQAVTILAAMSRRTGLVTETVTAADINNTNERAYGIIND